MTDRTQPQDASAPGLPGAAGPSVAMSTSLRSEPAFMRWVAAEGVSMVGTAVSTVVLPLLVYDITGSAAQTGLLFALRAVPYLVLGLVAGPIADRGNRRVLIIGGNLAEGALVLTIPVAALLGSLTAEHVYLVALLSATVFVFSDAAVFGAVPALVGRARLPAANGLLATIGSVAEIVGPVLGGVLVALVGGSTAILVTALTFLVAGAVQSRIRSTFRPPGAVAAHGEATLRSHVGTAVRVIRDDRVIATLLGVGFGNSFAFGAVLGLLVPYAVETLGLPADDGRIGLLYGTIGAGSLVAGALFSRVFRADRVRLLTPGTLLASSALAAALSINVSWLTATVLILVFSFSMATTIGIGITYRQLVAPDHLRSSINVIGRMVAWGGQPFGAAVGAAVTGATSVGVAYAVAAAVMAVSGLLATVLLWSTSTDLPGD